jgi:CBS-domain-containing membrane protein
VTHPPAGAHSVIYSSGEYGWIFYLLVVLASILSLIPAVIVNNFSDRRQYPTYWLKDNWYRKLMVSKRTVNSTQKNEKERATKKVGALSRVPSADVGRET